MAEGQSWVRIKQEGLVVRGPCRLFGLVFFPNWTNTSVVVYDGFQEEGSERFAVFASGTSETKVVNFPGGVDFTSGIYVVSVTAGAEITVVYQRKE